MNKSEYTCEWATCARRGLPQTSRSALISHLRSHTGEEFPSRARHTSASTAVVFPTVRAYNKRLTVISDDEYLTPSESDEDDLEQSEGTRYLGE